MRKTLSDDNPFPNVPCGDVRRPGIRQSVFPERPKYGKKRDRGRRERVKKSKNPDHIPIFNLSGDNIQHDRRQPEEDREQDQDRNRQFLRGHGRMVKVHDRTDNAIRRRMVPAPTHPASGRNPQETAKSPGRRSLKPD